MNENFSPDLVKSFRGSFIVDCRLRVGHEDNVFTNMIEANVIIVAPFSVLSLDSFKANKLQVSSQDTPSLM